MAHSNHLHALQAKHKSLEEAIHGEMQRPRPDEALITQMKKQKLSIKQKLYS